MEAHLIHVRLLLSLFPGGSGERRRVVDVIFVAVSRRGNDVRGIVAEGVSILMSFGWIGCRGEEGDEEIMMSPFRVWVL